MFSRLWEAIIGLIVGALAKFIMPGKDPGGIFITMLIGVAGALLATFIGSHVAHTRRASAPGSHVSAGRNRPLSPLPPVQGQISRHLNRTSGFVHDRGASSPNTTLSVPPYPRLPQLIHSATPYPCLVRSHRRA